ncbi:hypothetical protein BSLG_006307 [Batrachochytrium salamandrivorans]|nr:hypothetical protein BSLG_006307 [Batrachochytrium salamandrivorans]
MSDSDPIIKTAGFDARFPNTNQYRTGLDDILTEVVAKLADYHKCVQVKGEEFQPCQEFKSIYRSLCPTKWTERWDEQREADVFPSLHSRKTVRDAEHH